MRLNMDPGFTLAAFTSGCAICGTPYKIEPGESEQVLLTDVNIEWEGDIEICRPCIIEAAHLFHYRDDEIADLKRQVDEAQQYGADVYEALNDREVTISTLAAALHRTNVPVGV